MRRTFLLRTSEAACNQGTLRRKRNRHRRCVRAKGARHALSAIRAVICKRTLPARHAPRQCTRKRTQRVAAPPSLQSSGCSTMSLWSRGRSSSVRGWVAGWVPGFWRVSGTPASAQRRRTWMVSTPSQRAACLTHRSSRVPPLPHLCRRRRRVRLGILGQETGHLPGRWARPVKRDSREQLDLEASGSLTNISVSYSSTIPTSCLMEEYRSWSHLRIEHLYLCQLGKSISSWGLACWCCCGGLVWLAAGSASAATGTACHMELTACQ